MDNYFIKTNRHYWGFGSTLHEAMQNASVGTFSLMDACIETIEATSGSKMLQEYLKDTIEDYCCDEDDETEAFITITDSDRWEWSRVNEVDGSPSYNWIGEGEKPDKLEYTSLHVIIKGTGEIKLLEQVAQ